MTAGTLREAFQEVTPDNAGQALFTRCERETLVRFPQTKAILFTIRTYIRNLAWYAARPDECATLAEALHNLPEDLVSFFALVPLLQCLSASTCHLPACLCLAVILYCKINEVPICLVVVHVEENAQLYAAISCTFGLCRVQQ